MYEHAKKCERCMKLLRTSEKFVGSKRLGRKERRQLLAASAPGEEPTPIHPPGPAAAEQTGTRRAVANLIIFGLIEVAPNKLRLVPGEDDEELARLGRNYSVVRLASRTVFGEEIVRRYRSELEDGRPIRWMVGLNSAVEATVARCPDGGEQAISKKKAVQVRELRRRSRLS